MKVFCFLSSYFFACLVSSAQTSFQKVPLRTIIAAAPNDFNAFKGDHSPASDDSSFASIVTIEGSKTNEIVQLPGGLTQYHAYIADSATKKAADELVAEWRRKIKAASPGYIEEKINSKVQKRTTTGHRFSKVMANELYSISIVCSKREIDHFYWVLLTVTRQGKAVLTDDSGNEEGHLAGSGDVSSPFANGEK